MMWASVSLVCLTLASTVAINRPVYKVVLTQKGYTQFLQYDVETPPLREFTFCTWIRIYDLGGDQSIFTYVANGNNRVLRLWLDSGGRYMKVSINGRVTSSTLVELVKDVWRHVCLSYQSDFGAWAIYIDAKLVSCEVAQSLYGFILPRGGSLIIGYGTADSGGPSGLEGEIFGANMILMSTIERNYTTKLNHLYDQKAFKRNKIKGSDKNMKYVILGDLQTDEIHNNFEKSQVTPIKNKTNSYVKIQTPYSNFEHSVGLDVDSRKPHVVDTSNEKEIFDFSVTEHGRTTTEKAKINFWNLVNKAGYEGKFKVQKKNKTVTEISGSSTQDLATISEYETPPPPPGPINEYFGTTNSVKKPPLPKSIFSISPEEDGFNTPKVQSNSKTTGSLPDVDTPPPLPEKDTKVYGQWTSSKFAGSVLNYLKSINFNYNREKKTPSTIPLNKISDNYPYASDFKLTKLRPPVQFQRRNIVDHKIKIKKRGITNPPQINVQILEDDLRSTILKLHAETQAKNVEVTNRGQTYLSNRFSRNVDSQVSSIESSESGENIYKPRPFKVAPVKKKKNKLPSDFDLHRNNNLMTILPFLKSLEYFVQDSQNIESDNIVRGSDMYSKSLSNANKWHNVKSYSNDYTPRRINIDSNEGKSYIDAKIAEANIKHPSIRLKYKHENHKIVKDNDDPSILKGRELAMSVSNQSNTNRESISILKYNHGFLPSHDTKLKNSEKINYGIKPSKKHKRLEGKSNFNKHVKLGNALNERDVIGYNEEHKKQSFVGGDDKIPDINRYRSDLDQENVNVPSSLGPRVCKDIELEDHVLYVHPDQSIDASHIMSPVKKKNIGVEFVQQNYKKCSLDGSNFEQSYLLLLDWNKTPVRLFGGAYPKTTTDLCGFFK